MKRILIALVLACALAYPTMAANYTPISVDLSASGSYYPAIPYVPTLNDGTTAIEWIANSPSGWFNWSNPSGYNISYVYLYQTGNRPTKVRTATGLSAAYSISSPGWNAIPVPGGSTTGWIRVEGAGGVYFGGSEVYYSDILPEPSTSINFTCYPTTGVGSLDTTCQASGVGFSIYNWTWGDGTVTNSSVFVTGHTYGAPGLFSPRIDAYSSTFSQWYNYTRSDYIAVSNTTGATQRISLIAHTYDATRGAKIAPSQIKMQNITSGLWLNWSTTGGTAIFDSMDPPDDTELLSVGQTVKLCGYAPGYAETCGNLTIPYNNYEHSINLIATDAVPTAGNSTLIVNVIDSRTAARIAGATITVSNTSVPYSSSKLGDSNGVATFAGIPAAGAYQISVSKTGYVSATRFWPVASGEISNAYIGILPIGATPVPTGTGGDPIYDTPTTIGTTLAPGATPDTRTDEEKDSDMMGLLRDNGEALIQFFILCFVLYMIMGIGKR